MRGQWGAGQEVRGKGEREGEEEEDDE